MGVLLCVLDSQLECPFLEASQILYVTGPRRNLDTVTTAC